MPKSENANLVGKIKKEKLKDIAQQVVFDYDSDLNARSDYDEKRNKHYKMWAGVLPPKNDPWPGCSNVNIPWLAMACNQFASRAYQSIFAPPGMVKAIPVSQNDFKRAQNVEKFMNWQTLYEMEEYETEFDKLLTALPRGGFEVKKVWFDFEHERPKTQYIRGSDIVLPFGTTNIDTARRKVHRIWLFYDEIKKRKESKHWLNADDIPEQGGKQDESEITESSEKVSSEPDREHTEERPHLILEAHKELDLGEGRKPYIVTVHYDTSTCVRITSREFEGKKEVNHFIDYHFLPNPEGFYSLGFGHFIEPLVSMANTAFNQIFDAGKLSNMPFGFYGRRAGIKKKKLTLKPGMMEEIEDATQVHFPSLQRVDQVLFMLLGQLQQYVEQFTSISDYLMGREAKGTKTPTAHGTLAIIEQGLVTFSVLTKRIFRSLKKELRLIMELNSLFLGDSKQYRVMESMDKIAFPEIKREEFDAVYDVIPIGDPSYASKETRRREAQEVLATVMNFPLIAGNPEAGIQPNQRAMIAALSNFLDSYDIKNKSDIIPKLPDPPIDPEEENAMFMQGDYEPPKFGEDHKHHLETHTAFRNSEVWEIVPEAGKDLHDKHVKETFQIAYMEEAGREQLGGAPIGEEAADAGQ